MLVLTGPSGDFENLGKFESIEKGFTNLKSSSKGRLVLKKIQLGKFVFDEIETKRFRESLPENVTGIALNRKFFDDESEYNYEYIYSIWIYCEKEAIRRDFRNSSNKYSNFFII